MAIRFWGARAATGALLAVGLSMIPAMAQNNGGMSGSQSMENHSATSSTNPNQRAVNFLNTLNTDEINSAKMIEGKTKNDQVKDFAQTLQTDHQNAQDQLKQVASTDNLNLGTDHMLQRKDKRVDHKLSNAKDETQRDAEYVRAEARGHRHAIEMAQRLQNEVTDQNLKTYLASYIPTLQKHEQLAHSTEAALHITPMNNGQGAASSTPAGQSQSPSNAPPRP